MKRNLKDRFVQIAGKEIENTLKETTLLKAVCNLERKNIDSIDFDPKIVQQKNYQHIGLGSFIKNNIKGLSKKYEAPSGTLNNKLSFCQAAVSSIDSYTDLSPSAQRMVKKIFDFIKLNNM